MAMFGVAIVVMIATRRESVCRSRRRLFVGLASMAAGGRCSPGWSTATGSGASPCRPDCWPWPDCWPGPRDLSGCADMGAAGDEHLRRPRARGRDARAIPLGARPRRGSRGAAYCQLVRAGQRGVLLRPRARRWGPAWRQPSSRGGLVGGGHAVRHRLSRADEPPDQRATGAPAVEESSARRVPGGGARATRGHAHAHRRGVRVDGRRRARVCRCRGRSRRGAGCCSGCSPRDRWSAVSSMAWSEVVGPVAHRVTWWTCAMFAGLLPLLWVPGC